MVKMGVYGLIRLFVFMLPDDPVARVIWGLLLATLGAVNMVVGNLRALGERHPKRLVAQSSIGQIGYIVLGVGMAVALAGRAPLLAAVAFAGALSRLITTRRSSRCSSSRWRWNTTAAPSTSRNSAAC